MFRLFIALTLFTLIRCSTGISATEKKVVLSDSTEFYTLHIEYPDDYRDVDGVMKTFSHEAFDKKKEEWKVGGELYNEEKKVSEMFADRAYVKYAYHQEFESFLEDSLETISYLFTIYEYTGGANGNVITKTFTFNKDKKLVDIQDILDFNDYKDIKLSRLLADKALSDTTLFFKDFVEPGLGLAYLKGDGITLDHDKCNCDGYFFGSNFQNFVIRKDGITFYFDKYTLAPGAAGITKVHLSWDELTPYLKKPLPF
ncbi:RsiV family protein [Leadbetterella byssophila]|jgi:hypothetical protein|uniref:RsiV family protein n=1 Tax=Leadbetterella byssophila TaxID=316068 RepID=UPI0039A1FC3F